MRTNTRFFMSLSSVATCMFCFANTVALHLPAMVLVPVVIAGVAATCFFAYQFRQEQKMNF